MGVAAGGSAAAQERFMLQALEMAGRSLAAGGPPVGACLVLNDAVLATTHNAVIQELDVTAHAEMQALRLACREARALNLRGATLFVTLQPCVMCLAACYYAGIEHIYFGAPIAALESHTGQELSMPAEQLFKGAHAAPIVTGGLLAEECSALFSQWSAMQSGAPRSGKPR